MGRSELVTYLLGKGVDVSVDEFSPALGVFYLSCRWKKALKKGPQCPRTMNQLMRPKGAGKRNQSCLRHFRGVRQDAQSQDDVGFRV